MNGLLDFLRTPEGVGLLGAVGGYASNAQRGAPINSIGRGLLAGTLAYGQGLDRQERISENAQQKQVRDIQMQAGLLGLDKTRRDMAQEEAIQNAAKQSMVSPEQANAMSMGPMPDGSFLPQVQPGFNQASFLQSLKGIAPLKAMEFEQTMRKANAPVSVAAGASLVDPTTNRAVYTAPKQEDTPSAVREYQFAKQQGFGGTFEQWQLAQRRAGASSNSTNVTYGAPVAGIGPDGNPVFFQPPNRAGEPPQIIPGIQPPKVGEEMRDRAQQRATTIQGVEDSLGVLDKAINHPGRATATGLSSVLDPRNIIPGTQAKDLQVLKDQIGGKAFLQAFESLKGGGQITQVEGEKATAAIARLNTAQSDKEYVEALNEFRGIVSKGYERLAGKPYQAKTREASGSVGGAEARAPSQNVVQKLPTNAPKGSRARDLESGKIVVFDGMRWKPE